MIKKLGRAVYGSLKWAFYMVVLAAVLVTMLAMALIATPVVFVVLWRAQSMVEAFDEIMEVIADKIANSFDGWEKTVAFRKEVMEDDEEVFPRV